MNRLTTLTIIFLVVIFVSSWISADRYYKIDHATDNMISNCKYYSGEEFDDDQCKSIVEELTTETWHSHKATST